MDQLKVNKTDYAQAIGYDVSFISRFFSKERRPSDINAFMTSTVQYLIDNYSDRDSLTELSELIEDDMTEMTEQLRKETLNLWIASNLTLKKKNAQLMLQDIDSFDPSSYTNTSIFRSGISVAQLFDFSNTKTYKDVEGFKQAVLDFAKVSLLSHSKEDLFIYDDVPVDAVIGSQDNYFNELIPATTIILKKGLHINTVHVMERDSNENILGMRFWIPLMMSGLVQKRCIERENNDEHRVLFVSGGCALTGSFSGKNRTEGSFTLIRNKHLLPVYKENAKLLLQNSKPLVYTYNKENNREFLEFLDKQIRQPKNLQIVLSSPYAALINESLLKKLMKENKMDDQSAEANALSSFIEKRQKLLFALLDHNEIDLRLLVLSEQEFENYPAVFTPIGFNMEKPLVYSYDLYCQHIVQIETLSRKYPNLHLTLMNEYELSTVQIVARENEWFAVCKTSWPPINFVTDHPELCKALKQSADLQFGEKR